MTEDQDAAVRQAALACYVLGHVRGTVGLLPRSAREQLSVVLTDLLETLDRVDRGEPTGSTRRQ